MEANLAEAHPGWPTSTRQVSSKGFRCNKRHGLFYFVVAFTVNESRVTIFWIFRIWWGKLLLVNPRKILYSWLYVMKLESWWKRCQMFDSSFEIYYISLTPWALLKRTQIAHPSLHRSDSTSLPLRILSQLELQASAYFVCLTTFPKPIASKETKSIKAISRFACWS